MALSERNTIERIGPNDPLALGQFCDIITEVDMTDGLYHRSVFTAWDPLHLPADGDYQKMLGSLFQSKIHPEDAQTLIHMLDLKRLRRVYKENCALQPFCFRMREEKGKTIWLCSQIVFSHSKSAPLFFILTRNVTAQKEQSLKEQLYGQYNAALRKIYDEVYELNLTADAYRILYHVEDKYVVPARQGILSETLPYVAGHMIHPDDRERFTQFFDLGAMRAAFGAGKESVLGEFRKLWTDGEYHWASLTVFPLKQEKREDEIFLCFIMDIEEKKRADAIEEENRSLLARRLDDERYRIVVERTGTYVFEWLPESNRRFIAPEIADKFEGSYRDGRDIFAVWLDDRVVHPEDVQYLRDFVSELLASRSSRTITLRLLTRQKDYIWCKITCTNLYDEGGTVNRLVGTLNDVDEMVRSEQALKYRAEYDTLTGLYNAEAFYSHAAKLISGQKDQRFAVIRMDFNRFKMVNDLYGFDEGDRLLIHAASVLNQDTEKGSLCARMASDVFCLCVPYWEKAELISLVSRIEKDISEYRQSITASPFFGICLIEEQNVPVSILCDWASLALQTVKGNLIQKWAFYDDTLRERQLEEQRIEESMGPALERGEFVVYLQPKHDTKTHEIVGAEALVRWKRPQGMLLPGKFIPLFERNGFIIRLDEYVWETTFRTIHGWLKQGLTPPPVSLNVSRLHAYNQEFKHKIAELVKKYQIPNTLIELELTETTLVDNLNDLYQTIESLQEIGFLFSMDDFGSGYSSLNMLKNAPVNVLKLDRGFLAETSATEKGKIVVQHTISMAKELQLQVVAEGVETKEQAVFLMESGCTAAQGFYFSKPMPIPDFERLVFGG